MPRLLATIIGVFAACLAWTVGIAPRIMAWILPASGRPFALLVLFVILPALGSFAIFAATGVWREAEATGEKALIVLGSIALPALAVGLVLLVYPMAP